MAGGYDHIVDERGNLISNEEFVGMIENLGDAYELAEELYGMIWRLARMAEDAPDNKLDAMTIVKIACDEFEEGLAFARLTPRKEKARR